MPPRASICRKSNSLFGGVRDAPGIAAETAETEEDAFVPTDALHESDTDKKSMKGQSATCKVSTVNLQAV